MPLRLFPPGTRKGNRFYLAKGRAGGRQVEFVCRDEGGRKTADPRAAELCVERFMAALARAALPAVPPPAAEYVYFLAAGTDAIKIGTSRRPEMRLADLAVGSAAPLELLAKLPGGYELEKRIHVEFRHLRIRGEWFRRAPELLRFIAALE